MMNLKCPDIAYFTGVMQSDGSFSIYNVRKNKKIYKRKALCVQVGKLSLPMLNNFCKILDKYFNRRISIIKTSRGLYDVHTSINKLSSLFEELEILPKKLIAPLWIRNHINLFGPYLAGIIDGDGDVRVKRPKYPQYAIRITSEENPCLLKELVVKFLKCGVHFHKCQKSGVFADGRLVIGNCYELEFYISKKNALNIKKYILPYITIEHKKKLIKKAIRVNMPG